MTSEATPRAGRGHLLKILGVTFGISAAVGTMIGAGVLRAPAAIAGTIPDAAWIMALWVVGGLHVLLGVNVMSELATAVPKSGGPYVYAQRAFGDVAGLVVGWSVFLSFLAGIAATSIAFGEFLPLVLPAAKPYTIPVAIGVQIVLYVVNAFGLREGRAVQEVTSLIKTVMLLVFAGAAIAVAAPHVAVAVAPASHAALGWAAVIGAYSLVVGAYSGWPAPAFFTEENEAPSSSIPRAMVIGVLATAFVYISVNAALIHALGVGGVAASPLPFNIVLDRFGGSLPGTLFALGAMIAVASVVNSGIMAAPRSIFAMSREGLLPGVFHYVNRGGSPDMAMLLTAAGSLVLAATGSFALVFALIALLNSVAGVVVESSLFALRVREPDLPRPFRAWLYPWLPALVLAIDASLLVLFAAENLEGLAFAVGLAVACVPFAIVARRARRAEAVSGP